MVKQAKTIPLSILLNPPQKYFPRIPNAEYALNTFYILYVPLQHATVERHKSILHTFELSPLEYEIPHRIGKVQRDDSDHFFGVLMNVSIPHR